MDVEWVRRYCMGLPHTTETVQWGANLVFKIGGKIYAMAELEDADHWLSFKCSPEDFVEAGLKYRSLTVAARIESRLPIRAATVRERLCPAAGARRTPSCRSRSRQSPAPLPPHSEPNPPGDRRAPRGGR